MISNVPQGLSHRASCTCLGFRAWCCCVAWCSASNFCQYILRDFKTKKRLQKKIITNQKYSKRVYHFEHDYVSHHSSTQHWSRKKKKNSSQGDQSDNNSHWLSLLTCPNQGSFPLEWFWPPGRCWRMLDSGWFSNTIEILILSKCSAREFHLYVFS